MIDAGLKDLAGGRATRESLAVSVAAPRLRREGVPVTTPLPEPEFRLYELLEAAEGELAHARYNALMRRVVSTPSMPGMIRSLITRSTGAAARV